MNDRAERLTLQLQELKASFLSGFEAPGHQAAVEHCDLVLITAGKRTCALKVAELGGLHVDPVIMPLPSPLAALTGLVCLRGKLVPAYDLGTLLQEPKGTKRRWLGLLAGGRAALCFDAFEGYVRLPSSALMPSTTVERFATFVVEHQGLVRPVLSSVRLLDELTALTRGLQ